MFEGDFIHLSIRLPNAVPLRPVAVGLDPDRDALRLVGVLHGAVAKGRLVHDHALARGPPRRHRNCQLQAVPIKATLTPTSSSSVHQNREESPL